MSKRKNFSLAIFTLIEPIWVGNLGSGEKNWFFKQLIPDFDGNLVFYRILSVRETKMKFEARPKLKVGGGYCWAHMYAYNVFLKIFASFLNV